MKLSLEKFVALLLEIAFLTALSLAQTATGSPPFSTIGGGPDEIDLGNLNVHWSFPVFSKPGRGLSFAYALGYNSSFWTSDTGVWQAVDGWGWKGEGIGLLGSLTNIEELFPCGVSGKYTEDYNSWAYFDANGVEHDFPGDVYYNECTNVWTPLNGATATDGSGYILSASRAVYGRITTPSGITLSPVRVLTSSGVTGAPSSFTEGNGDIIDPNGNILQASAAGSYNASYTDTLGMAVLSNSGVAPNPISFNYIDTNGDTRSGCVDNAHECVIANFTNYTVQTNFGCSNIAEFGPRSVPLITSLSYPDGSSYSFSYESTPGYPGNVTGRIQTVTLRTGGTITYTYTGGNNGVVCADGSAAGFNRQTSDGTVSYTRSQINGSEWQTNITDEQGNLTQLWFQGIYETKRQNYQGSNTLLQTIQTCYNGSSPDCTGTGVGFPITQKTVLLQLPTGSQKETITSFNSAGLITETDAYDWGSNPTATLLQKVVTSYASPGNNILDRPYQVTTSDSTGQLAQTTYTYDEGTPTGTSNVPSHAAVSGGRGNATTISEWLNTGGSLASHKSYDDTGNVLTATDPGGHVAQYSYTDSFQDNVNRNSLAYVSQSTYPPTGSIQHITSAKYDANTGLPVSQTDENGQITSYLYDSMLRSTQISYPDGGQTVKNYPNTTTVETKQKQDSANWIDQYLYLDAYGRQSQTRLVDPEGDDYSETTYDAVHRTVSVTNPHRSISAATDGTSTTQYDALGRVTGLTHADGNTLQTSYNDTTVTVTDETGRQRKSISDGLGRLVEVDEESSQWIPANPGGPATAGTGNVTVNGSLQNAQVQTQAATSGTGHVNIFGSEQHVGRPVIYDQGELQITVNGYTITYDYGQNSTATNIASAFASAFQNDPNSPVNASASSTTITFTARATGSGTNYSVSGGVNFFDSADFGNASFGVNPANTSLSGGQDAVYTTVYDSGSTTITVNGHSDTYSWSGSGTNSSNITSGLASAINGDSSAPESASASGNVVYLTSKATGAASNYGLSSSYTWNTSQFGSPSFTTSNSGSALSGGADAVPPTPAHWLWSFSPAYETRYSFNGLGNLLCIEQHGAVSGTGCSSDSSLDASSSWRVRRFTYDSASRLLTAKNPESGTTQYAYAVDSTCNPDGLLSSTTDARGVSTTYCYDALHRTTKKSYSDGSSPREFYYDQSNHGYSIGRLTHASNDVNAAYDPTYDSMGRVISQTYCIPSDCSYGVSVSAQYDLAGHLIWFTYPAKRKIQNFYNSAGRLTKVNYDSFNGTSINSPFFTVAQAGTPSTWGYAPAGSLQLAVYGNGVTQTAGYNNRLEVNLISQATSSQTLFSRSYNYLDGNHSNGNNGNIIGIVDNLNSNHSQAYDYDALNRIITGYQNDNAFNQTFSYDAWGNGVQSGTWSFQQTFTGSNQIQDYSYDAAGDLLNDTFHNYTYDAESRMKTVDGTGASYTYGPAGQRVRKDVGSSWTEYLEFGGTVVAEKNAGGWTDYMFADGERIAMSSSSAMSSTQYYHPDHLGTARMMTDASANTISNCLYAPFGQETSCSPSNAANHYKFTDNERDAEANLDHTWFRQYEAGQGRWLSPDPYLGSMNPVSPQSLNRYSYVGNMSLTETDSLGLYQDPLEGSAPCSMCGQDTRAEERDAENRNFFGTAYFMLPSSHYLGANADEGEIWYQRMVDNAFNHTDFGPITNADYIIWVNCQGADYKDLDCALAPASQKHAYNGWEHAYTGWERTRAILAGVYQRGGGAADPRFYLSLGFSAAAIGPQTVLLGDVITGDVTVGWQAGELTFTRYGVDYTPDKFLRINPLGDWDNANPYSRRPHYHRRPGIEKHRPWEGGW